MRMAIYYDILPQTGNRNDGNPLYVLRALKRRQERGMLEVDHLAPMENVNLFGQYDLNLYVDWGEDALLSLLPYTPIEIPRPNVAWMSDTHLGYQYRLEKSRKFDHVFVAQKQAVEEFRRDGVEAEWLPHAFEPEAYHDLTNRDEKGNPIPFYFASKRYDVCFVGHVNSENRIDYLDRMFREFPNFYFGQKQFQDAARVYAESKIVMNIAMKDDLNMRCFETIGSGAFLLTDRVPGMEECGFIDGETCALWSTLDEAAAKARYYLAHDEERERIARAGFELAMKRHTIDHRVDRMLEKAGVVAQAL